MKAAGAHSIGARQLKSKEGETMGSRLFLIDSSPAVQRLIEQAVAGEALEMRAFRRAHPALEAAKRQKPDLVVVDYHLEDMTFAQFCESLRATERFAGTPIITLLGSSDRPDERQLQGLGVKAVLKKPLQVEDVLAMVQQVTQGMVDDTPSGAPEEGLTGACTDTEPVRMSDLVLKSEAPISQGVVSDAMRGIVAQLVQSIIEQAERTFTARTPDIVAAQLSGCLDSPSVKEKLFEHIQNAVTRQLPIQVGERVTAMQPLIQQTVVATTERLIKEVLDVLVKEMVAAMLPACVADALKEHLVRAGDLMKEMAQEAALRQARETSETIVREVARDVVKGVFEQAMREMAAGLTPAR
jgi:CheY-like chemotaxis protein